MTVERWHTDAMWRRTEDPVRDLRELERLRPVYVEIADTGDANSLHTLRHGLGRVPRGVRIVNVAVGASGDVSWHRLDTDAAWTNEELSLRISAGNARVLLEVF